ncbi:MAG: methyltransferase domain-containing protein [Rhodocyclaceae bacterium]
MCETPGTRFFLRVDDVRYWRCERCSATFMAPDQRPSRARERAEYELHRNDAADPGYQAFLSRVAQPLLERLSSPCHGLDYGCGPGPALATLVRAAGHTVALYDPFFHPDPEVLTRRYDFIACTEVAEHFHQPAEEFRRLDGMLAPGGWLALMTRFQTDDARFANWHYRRDPTHVVFYRDDTVRFIAAALGWRCQILGADVAMLQKPAG